MEKIANKRKSEMDNKQEIIRKHLTCKCDRAYKDRGLTDPSCFLCEYEDEIIEMMDEYCKHLTHYRDTTVGLWATDKPEKVQDPEKVMFKLEEGEVIK